MTNQDTSVSFADLVSMFLERVKAMPGEKGVPNSRSKLFEGNVIPQKEAKKPLNTTLTGPEKLRTYNIFTILAEALYNFNQTKKADTKQGTILSQAKGQIDSSKQSKADKPNSEGLGWLATAAAAVIALSVLTYKYLGPIGTFISKFLIKLPNILDSLTSVKEFIKTKLLTVLDSFKATKIGQSLTTTASKLKSGTIGKMISEIGLSFGKKAGLIFKKLPLFGALMSFTYAYLRYKEGKYFTALLELISGIFTLSGYFGFVPGFAISLAIDGIILLSDFLSDESKTTSTKSSVIHGAKLGGKALSKMLGKISSKIGVKLLKVLKWVPLVGGVVGLALSYMRFKEGDWIGGILELISAVADLVGPVTAGVGTAISWVLDGVLILYDIFKTDTSGSESSKETPKESRSGFSLSGLLSSVANTVGVKLLKVLKFVPFIGGLSNLVLAYTRFKEGDWGAGVLELVAGFSKFVGVGTPIGWLVDGALLLYDLFKSKKTTDGNIKTSGNITLSSLISKLLKAASDRLISVFTEANKLFLSAPINVAKTAVKVNDVMSDMSQSFLSRIVDSATKTADTAKNTTIGISKYFFKGTMGIAAGATNAVQNMFTDTTDVFSQSSKDVIKNAAAGMSAQSALMADSIKKSNTANAKLLNDTSQSSLISESVQKSNATNAKLLNDANQQSAAIVDYSNSLRDNIIDITNQKITVEKTINIPNLDIKVPELVDQNRLIELQNQLLIQLLTTSREQLTVTKNQKPTQVVTSGNSNTAAINSSNAFSTNRQDGRSMYNSSPYSMSPSFA